MPAATPKQPEAIQAQLATFAAERIDHYYDSVHVLNNLSNLAIGEAGDITRVTTSVERQKGEDGNNSIRIPEGTERTVATVAEYTNFLRDVGGSRYEAIQGRAEMLKNYVRFEPIIKRLKAELADPAVRKEHSNFLGNGSTSMVFSITEGDRSYAVRVPNGTGTSPAKIDSHLAGAVLGKGVPHLEQIVAASYDDGVTVAEIMPGKEVGRLTLDEVKGVTDEQLGELVGTLVVVSERGIELDLKPSNIFYDQKEGYGIVDYHSSKVASKTSDDQDLGNNVGYMAGTINCAGFNAKYDDSIKTKEDFARDLEFIKANLDVMNRYRTVVEQKLTGETQKTALALIDKRLESAQETLEDYSNPEWVAESIAQEQERERQRKEYIRNRTPGDDVMLKLGIV